VDTDVLAIGRHVARNGRFRRKYLSAFDALRTSIQDVAREAYSHIRRNFYALTAADFCYIDP
jgi:hypothetical protein